MKTIDTYKAQKSVAALCCIRNTADKKTMVKWSGMMLHLTGMLEITYRKWRQRPDGYLRGDDVYDSAAFGKVVDVDGTGRQQMYPALITSRQAHVQTGVVGRSPSQPTGYYAGPRCPHGPSCPVHHPVTDGGSGGVLWDGGHDCCQTGRRLEHVYEIAAGGFTTRCRAPVHADIDDSYLPPGQTQTDAPPMTAADQLFDAGRV